MYSMLLEKGIDKEKIIVAPYKKLEDKVKNTNTNIDKKRDSFLYISSDDPHKNHKNLIEAWCILAIENVYPKLILTVDNKSDLYSYIENKSKVYGLDIDLISNVERKSLLNLYKQSTALIFPSFIESYGLPLVEAKYFELPVIASELDYVRDILDPVETFDPNSAKSISRSVKRFLKIKDEKTEIVLPVEFIKNVINLL